MIIHMNWHSVCLADVCRLETWRDTSNSHKHDISFFTLWWLAELFFLFEVVIYLHILCLSHIWLILLIKIWMLTLFLYFNFFLAVLSVDAIDMSGKHEVDLDTNIWKVWNSEKHCIRFCLLILIPTLASFIGWNL